MNMRKIAIIVSTLRIGGAEIQSVELANSLAAKGCEVTLISLDSRTDIKERISPGIPVHILNKRNFMDLRVLRRLIWIIKAFQPEAMIMTNSYATMLGYFARFFSGQRIKMVSVQHTTLVTDFRDKLENHFYRRIINRMDAVVFVCENQRKYWVKNYGIKAAVSRVVYNGVDLERFAGFQGDTAALRAKLGFSPEDVVIGINAGFRPEKKHEDLLEAAGILTGQGYPVKVLFIGDGETRPRMEELVRSKGLGDIVRFTGFVNDVRPYLDCLDISLLTSVAIETLSIAIIESMAMGKPVILSGIGGAAELVDEGSNGLLYQAGNVPQLVKAVAAVIDGDMFDSMGRKSREKARTLFGKDSMVKGYLDILDEK